MELKVHDQEVLLQRLWKSRKLFKKPLQTISGNQVEVLFAGSENLDAGPDFKDAVIKIDDRIMKGDIEVHLEAEGWYAHQHHLDPAYNRVILHIISQENSGQKVIEREDGVTVHQVCVDHKELDLKSQRDVADGKSPRPSVAIVETCPLKDETRDKILSTIQAAGERRFSNKVEQLRERLKAVSWDQLMYQRILEALGFSKNQIPFRRLAELVPYELVTNEMHWVAEDMAIKRCAALLFGAAGLLPSQTNLAEADLDSETLEYVSPLEVLWNRMSHRLAIKPMQKREWQFFRLRPQNFPTRRIAGMVVILHRFYKTGFLSVYQKLLSGRGKNPDVMVRELEQSLTVKAEGYWLRHYRFGEDINKIKKETVLIGESRARDIVINIVLPIIYLYAGESNDGRLRNLVRELFVRYPKASDNIITKAMKKQLFPVKSQAARTVTSASQQQGLLHLHKLYCPELKCRECLSLSFSSNFVSER